MSIEHGLTPVTVIIIIHQPGFL